MSLLDRSTPVAPPADASAGVRWVNTAEGRAGTSAKVWA